MTSAQEKWGALWNFLFLMHFLEDNILYSCWGNQEHPCDLLGKDSWKLVSGLLWTLPLVHFPFADILSL